VSFRPETNQKVLFCQLTDFLNYTIILRKKINYIISISNIIGYGNADNNLESLCMLIKIRCNRLHSNPFILALFSPRIVCDIYDAVCTGISLIFNKTTRKNGLLLS
jgi:hypothetical protein